MIDDEKALFGVNKGGLGERVVVAGCVKVRVSRAQGYESARSGSGANPALFPPRSH